MKFSNPDMMLRIACGDAVALPTEYVKPGDPIIARTLRFKQYHDHPSHGQGRAGRYSDDAEMSAANAHVLLGDFEPTELGFATAYLAEFERGGCRDGYARGFQKLLESVRGEPEEFLRRLKSLNSKTHQPHNCSKKNGAAMRSVPFGVMSDLRKMSELVSLQAAITHNSFEGVFSARAVALMSHFALYVDEPFIHMGEWCVEHLPREERTLRAILTTPWRGGAVTSGKGVPVSLATVWAVADLLREDHSLMGMMHRLIAWGGDTDSVGAIAWGIASARYQDEVLPEFIERDLEQGNPRTGTLYLQELGKSLMNRYN